MWGGGEVFGPGLPGAQTTHIRVAYGDNCLCHIPEHVPDEQAVFVGDVFSTGFHGAHEGRIETGDTVVVFGCGPIGLGAVISAGLFGPRNIFAVDMFENRLSLARQFGAETIDVGSGRVPEIIREATSGEGADVAIEAVGHPETFQMSLRSLRRGGRVSVVGIFSVPVELRTQVLCGYGITISMGLGNISRMSRLMGLVAEGRVNLAPLATHTFPLDKAMEAYDLFENHKEECVKVLLKP
jgi:alcohol dehydrogenase